MRLHCFYAEHGREGQRIRDEKIRYRPDSIAGKGIGKPGFIGRERTKQKVVMVTDCLIEGDRFIESRCLEWSLIINVFSTKMGTGAWSIDLTVNNVDISSEFVVRSTVTGVTKRDEEIKRIFLVQGICRLNGSIKNMGCVHHDRRIDGGITSGKLLLQLLEVYERVWSFLVSDVDIGHGKKVQKFCRWFN